MTEVGHSRPDRIGSFRPGTSTLARAGSNPSPAYPPPSLGEVLRVTRWAESSRRRESDLRPLEACAQESVSLVGRRGTQPEVALSPVCP